MLEILGVWRGEGGRAILIMLCSKTAAPKNLKLAEYQSV